jgi:peptidoglycan/xylan/chitin deacetylase (PgdA/CDA1 family)
MLRHGFPILQRLGVPATVFVGAGLVDVHDQPLRGAGIDLWRETPHREELYCVSWEQLRQLQAAGWEIGAHSMTHPLLTRLDDDALAWELQESKRRCEAMLGVPCRTMAYPTGNFDARVERAVAIAGYEAAAALPRRFDNPRPLAWPRISIQRQDSDLVFRVKVAPLIRALRRTRGWLLLDDIRLHASLGKRTGPSQS